MSRCPGQTAPDRPDWVGESEMTQREENHYQCLVTPHAHYTRATWTSLLLSGYGWRERGRFVCLPFISPSLWHYILLHHWCDSHTLPFSLPDCPIQVQTLSLMRNKKQAKQNRVHLQDSGLPGRMGNRWKPGAKTCVPYREGRNETPVPANLPPRLSLNYSHSCHQV